MAVEMVDATFDSARFREDVENRVKEIEYRTFTYQATDANLSDQPLDSFIPIFAQQLEDLLGADLKMSDYFTVNPVQTYAQ